MIFRRLAIIFIIASCFITNGNLCAMDPLVLLEERLAALTLREETVEERMRLSRAALDFINFWLAQSDARIDTVRLQPVSFFGPSCGESFVQNWDMVTRKLDELAGHGLASQPLLVEKFRELLVLENREKIAIKAIIIGKFQESGNQMARAISGRTHESHKGARTKDLRRAYFSGVDPRVLGQERKKQENLEKSKQRSGIKKNCFDKMNRALRSFGLRLN